jgi:hypothetical protein
MECVICLDSIHTGHFHKFNCCNNWVHSSCLNHWVISNKNTNKNTNYLCFICCQKNYAIQNILSLHPSYTTTTLDISSNSHNTITNPAPALFTQIAIPPIESVEPQSRFLLKLTYAIFSTSLMLFCLIYISK